MIRLRLRSTPTLFRTIMAYLAALAINLLVAVLLILFSGAAVGEALHALVRGAVGSRSAVLSSLTTATPLLLTGLATVIAYRAGVWTVGQEGQVIAGAMAAYQASLWLAGAPAVVLLPVCILAGLAGGALLSGLAAWLKARFAISEIVSTVMLNYLVLDLLSYLLGSPWASKGGSASYQQTPVLPSGEWLPRLASGSKLHIGFLAALAGVGLLHLLLERTPLGYEIRAMGFNPIALRQRGTDPARTTMTVMLLSGGLAALAGVGEVFGVVHRLNADTLSGLGFNGIIIGMIGNLTPVGTLLAALFFGALHSGSLFMNVMTHVPAALITALQGVVLLLCLIAGVAARVEIVKDHR